MLGFTPIEKFIDYIGACDIVLNPYPTVGETSGSPRASTGKAVIADVGAFVELLGDVCLEVRYPQHHSRSPAGRRGLHLQYPQCFPRIRPDLAR